MTWNYLVSCGVLLLKVPNTSYQTSPRMMLVDSNTNNHTASIRIPFNLTAKSKLLNKSDNAYCGIIYMLEIQFTKSANCTQACS